MTVIGGDSDGWTDVKAGTVIPTIEPVLEAYLAKRTSETAGLVAKILAGIQAYDRGLVVELAEAGAIEARAAIAALLEAHVPQPHLPDGAEAPLTTLKIRTRVNCGW